MSDLVTSAGTLTSENWEEILRAQQITVAKDFPSLVAQEPQTAEQDPALFGTHIREAVRVLRGR